MSDDIQDVVADAAEFVSEEADRFAEFARQLSKTKVKFSLLGMIIGSTSASLIAFKVAYFARRAQVLSDRR